METREEFDRYMRCFKSLVSAIEASDSVYDAEEVNAFDEHRARVFAFFGRDIQALCDSFERAENIPF